MSEQSPQKQAYDQWLRDANESWATLNRVAASLQEAVQSIGELDPSLQSRYTSLSATAMEEASLWLTRHSIPVPPEHMVEHTLAMADGTGSTEQGGAEGSEQGGAPPPDAGDSGPPTERIDIP